MQDVLQLVFEYRALYLRSKTARYSPQIQARFEALARLFGSEPSASAHAEERIFARCPVQLQATLQMDDEAHKVLVEDLGAGGACISPAPPLRINDDALLLVGGEDGVIFVCRVRCMWRFRDENLRTQMGLSFVGGPTLLSQPCLQPRLQTYL